MDIVQFRDMHNTQYKAHSVSSGNSQINVVSFTRLQYVTLVIILTVQLPTRDLA